MTDNDILKKELLEISQEVKDEVKIILGSGVTTKKQMISIINMVFPKNTKLKLSVHKEIFKKIKSANIKINHIDINTLNHFAFVFKQASGEYGLFINRYFEREGKIYLKVHELSHILLNHFSALNAQKQEFERILKNNLVNIKHYFNKEALNSYYDDDLVNYLFKKLENIAKDMEINSKIFKEQWWLVNHTIQRGQLLLLAKNKEKYPFIIKEINRKINNKKSEILYCHPETFEYPPEMDWLYYMDCLLNNLDEHLKNDTFEFGEYDGLYSIEEIDMNINTQQEQEVFEKAYTKKISNSSSKSIKGNNPASHKIETCKTLSDFKKIIEKHCQTKSGKTLVSDYLYYYNRGRNNIGNILYPKRSHKKANKLSSMYIILDVSSSVPVVVVTNIINILKKIKSNKRSRLILWSDCLIRDELLSNKNITISGCGETRIATGIAYADKYIKHKEDRLIIVSDFKDRIFEWVETARNIKNCQKIAICHNTEDKKIVLNLETTLPEFTRQFKTYLISS